jgi:hypothetical protein
VGLFCDTASVIITDTWLAGMGSYLLDIWYCKQTLHGLDAVMKFIQLNTVFLCSTFCKVCIMEEYSQKFCKKYPLSVVPCAEV